MLIVVSLDTAHFFEACVLLWVRCIPDSLGLLFELHVGLHILVSRLDHVFATCG